MGAVVTVEGHPLSSTNTLLCLYQYQDVTIVGGFNQWKANGRKVKKGEHGLTMWIPRIPSKKDDEPQEAEGFVMGYVFDISQTDGEPLAEPPDWKSPEKHAELQERLVRYAESKGIQVLIKHIGRDIQGVSIGGKIILDPKAGTKTLIHEIAHDMLHQLLRCNNSGFLLPVTCCY